jgi:hypothetical protein
MKENIAIVEIERGLVTNVYTNVENLKVHVLDRDIEMCEDDIIEHNKRLEAVAKNLKKQTCITPEYKTPR